MTNPPPRIQGKPRDLNSSAQDLALSRFRLEPAKLKAYTVRPIQRLGVRIPHGRLTIQVAEVRDDFRLLHSGYAGMYPGKVRASGATDDGFIALFVWLANQEIKIASFISLQDVIEKHGVVATAIFLVSWTPRLHSAAQFRF